MIRDKDHETLGAIATDDQNDLPTRSGAVEGLARMSKAAAEKVLVKVGNAESNDEDLRKAAWRGLRRSKRALTK